MNLSTLSFNWVSLSSSLSSLSMWRTNPVGRNSDEPFSQFRDTWFSESSDRKQDIDVCTLPQFQTAADYLHSRLCLFVFRTTVNSAKLAMNLSGSIFLRMCAVNRKHHRKDAGIRKWDTISYHLYREMNKQVTSKHQVPNIFKIMTLITRVSRARKHTYEF